MVPESIEISTKIDPTPVIEGIKADFKKTARIYLTRNPASDTYVVPMEKSKPKAICGVTNNFISFFHGGPGVNRANKFLLDLERTNVPKEIVNIIRALFEKSSGDWKDQNSLKRMVYDELLQIANSMGIVSSVKYSKAAALRVLSNFEKSISTTNEKSSAI